MNVCREIGFGQLASLKAFMASFASSRLRENPIYIHTYIQDEDWLPSIQRRTDIQIDAQRIIPPHSNQQEYHSILWCIWDGQLLSHHSHQVLWLLVAHNQKSWWTNPNWNYIISACLTPCQSCGHFSWLPSLLHCSFLLSNSGRCWTIIRPLLPSVHTSFQCCWQHQDVPSLLPMIVLPEFPPTNHLKQTQVSLMHVLVTLSCQLSAY